jgi:hypothetical protein
LTTNGARLTVGAALVLLGLLVASYSYSQLSGQVVLFNQSSIQPGGHSYVTHDTADVNLDGRYAAKVTGGVGGPGCCVDFYLVNDTSWNSWSSNPGMRSALSMVHLNSAIVSSQLQSGQFSFVPPGSAGYQAVFVNDAYPNASNANIDANVTLHYDSTGALYATIAGLAILASGVVMLVLLMMKRVGAQRRVAETPTSSASMKVTVH